MRLWRGAPSWLPPTLIALTAVVGIVALDAHFDRQVRVAQAAEDLGSEALPSVLGSPQSDIGTDGGNPDSNEVLASRGSADGGLWADGTASGLPWSELGAIEGLLTFRGNPTRSFHGRGPVPVEPVVHWTFDVGCSQSAVAGEAKTWCGSGWTGQPAVFPSAVTGAWQIAFGAYNRAVNFLDPETGDLVLDPYVTGDIVKGTVTVDPDGYPLLYTGSRDNFFHVVALDRDRPTALWKLSATAVEPTLWNNDWDSSALVIDDHLIVGGENGRFFVVELNRAYDADGRVTVDPEIAFSTESWDRELLDDIGDVEVSVENSVAMWGDIAYFTNSAGLVQGWDIGDLESGTEPTRVFRYWTGDDTDASIVIDAEGMLYLGSQYERGNARSQEIGQVIKLDPRLPDDPIVWSRQANEGLDTGVWATPALHDDVVIIATDGGNVLGLDRESGVERWRLVLGGPLWSSPVVVDDTLIQADCSGNLNAFDLDGIEQPSLRWSLPLGGCLESTPAVWDGQIFIGSRTGMFYAIGDCRPGRDAGCGGDRSATQGRANRFVSSNTVITLGYESDAHVQTEYVPTSRSPPVRCGRPCPTCRRVW